MSESILSMVHPDLLEAIWSDVIAYLAPAIKRSKGVITKESLYVGIKEKDYLLWTSVRDGKFEAFAITCIIKHPGTKVLAIPLIGGKDRWNWLGFEPYFIDYGLKNECEFMEGYYRMGWLGLARKISKSVLNSDWEPMWTVARKRLNKESEV